MATGRAVATQTLIRRALRLRAARLRTPRPRTRPQTTALHLSLYALVLLMPLTGMMMALSANLNEIVFQGKGSLPATLTQTQGHLPHIIAGCLPALGIAAHIAMTDRAKITLKGDPMPRIHLRRPRSTRHAPALHCLIGNLGLAKRQRHEPSTQPLIKPSRAFLVPFREESPQGLDERMFQTQPNSPPSASGSARCYRPASPSPPGKTARATP